MKPSDVFLARFVRANRGDFANQAGVLAGLRRSPRVGQVYISTFYPHHFDAFDDVTAVTPAPVRGYMTNKEEGRLLRRGIPVYWGGGVDLQDTGSKVKMLLLAIRLRLLKRGGSRFVMAFQGAGPITTAVGRGFLRHICRLIDFAIVREPTAQKLLLEVARMPQERVALAVDSALLLDSPAVGSGDEYLARHGFDLSRPILGVNLRRWFHQRGGWLPTEFHQKKDDTPGEDRMEQLIENVAQAITRCEKFEQVVLLPMYRRYPEMWEDDILLLQRLKDRLPSNYRIAAVEEDLSAFDLLSVFSGLDLVLGVRLHSTIMAHVAGVPAVHIAYEHKGVEHFARMGMSDLVVGIEAACESAGVEMIQDLLVRAVGNREILSAEVTEKCKGLRDDAQACLEQSLGSVLGDEPPQVHEEVPRSAAGGC